MTLQTQSLYVGSLTRPVTFLRKKPKVGKCTAPCRGRQVVDPWREAPSAPPLGELLSECEAEGVRYEIWVRYKIRTTPPLRLAKCRLRRLLACSACGRLSQPVRAASSPRGGAEGASRRSLRFPPCNEPGGLGHQRIRTSSVASLERT